MKVIIFGASGSGKTTLGKALADSLGWTFLDSDVYYWEPTDPPFEQKIPLHIRNERLKTDFLRSSEVVVSGSLFTWSSYWNTVFDLGVFLQLPSEIRMSRLYQREIDRYGDALTTDLQTQQRSKEFLEWAAQYDTPDNDGHSITKHLNWIELLSCPVIELTGKLSTEEQVHIITERIASST